MLRLPPSRILNGALNLSCGWRWSAERVPDIKCAKQFTRTDIYNSRGQGDYTAFKQATSASRVSPAERIAFGVVHVLGTYFAQRCVYDVSHSPVRPFKRLRA